MHADLTVRVVNRSKKGLKSIDQKKSSKNTIAVLLNTSMIWWQAMNRGFTSMSPKINSSRLYGCFKMSQIQQKLLASKHFQSNDRLFFRQTGHDAILPLEQSRTVNSEWYTTIFSPVVFQEIRKTNRRRRITLHHDNASSHTATQTTVLLSTHNINLMSNPPYSPEFAPNSFFLFRYVKN